MDDTVNNENQTTLVNSRHYRWK